eukprot:g10688.t1
MRDPLRWSGVLMICLLQIASTGHARQHSQPEKDRSRRRKRGVTEADEDAAFAAEMLGLVYDRVKDVGDMFRVVGDTAGGLAGGSFKLLSASVNGLSSVLDAASRGVKANIKTADERFSTSPTPPAAASDHDTGDGSTDVFTSDNTRPSEAPGAQDGSSSSSGGGGGGSGSGGGATRGGRDGGPDPFDRIGSLALTSLAGSLQILSTAVGGIGDAVFQAGLLAEGLAGGTGQVAEDTVRLVQSFVGWARDDMIKLNTRKPQDHDSTKSFDAPRGGKRSRATSSAPPEQPVYSDTDNDDYSPSPAELPTSFTVLEAWEGVRDLWRYAVEAAVREVVTLFLLEERERDRVARLAWDEGYRRGQASRAVDPAVEAETAAWLNHMLTSTWGGTNGGGLPGGKGGMGGVSGVQDGNVCSHTGIFASDGLSSFVAEHLAEGLLEALEEMKPTSVVGVELLDVELGSSAPRILGIKTLDPSSSSAPGGGDGRCIQEGECVSLRVDLEVASQDVRVGVRVKVSTLEKALLPTGTVRLLEFYFRGSVSVRAETRDEFPFVSTAFVAFDYPPDVHVKLEQWGLDALTLGAVPAAVDEWARIALQQSCAPYVLPGFMEVDAAHALCPDCPAIVPAAARTAVDEPKGKTDTESRLPSSRRQSRKAVEGGTGSKMSLGKEGSIEKARRRLGSTTESKNDHRKRERPSVQDSSSLFSGAGATSPGVDAGEQDERTGARRKQGVAGDQEEIGPAAAMVENGGDLRWLKRFNEGRGEFWDWEGMD